MQLAYYQGVVLVRCPGCNNLHLVADRLGYFEDNSVDIEAIAREQGEIVRKGRLGQQAGAPQSGGVALGSVLSGPSLSSQAVSDPTVPSASASTGDAAQATGAVADQYVIEFSEADLAVLASRGKSVNLKTGAEVVEKLEYRSKPKADEPDR